VVASGKKNSGELRREIKRKAPRKKLGREKEVNTPNRGKKLILPAGGV